jgi:hypothetical protein
MGKEDQDEFTFTADDLGIEPPGSDQVICGSEHASRNPRDSRLPEAGLGAYLGDNLETALVKYADRQGPTY